MDPGVWENYENDIGGYLYSCQAQTDMMSST